MRLFPKIVASLLAVVLLLGTFPFAFFSFAGKAEAKIKDETLFSSSFEADDKQINVSTSDSSYYQNLERYSVNSSLLGEFTQYVNTTTITGSSDYKAEEGKSMLFDRKFSTKFLTDNKATDTSPVVVAFELDTARVLGVYSLTSANDENERDPRKWTLYGSANGSDYTELDTRSDSFSERGQTKSYTVENTTAYKYYKLEITQNGGGGMTQLADLRLGTGKGEADAVVGDSPLATEYSFGPTSSWTETGAFDGDSALAVYANQTAKKNTYARNLLYSGLNIKVTKNTVLSYVHFPAIVGDYDYEYTSTHMIIDIKFTDGKYLSELSALNQNGFEMEPVAMGESNSLYTSQWNYIETTLGDVAEGKTIDSIYVYFKKDSTSKAVKFSAYFDDLVIENKAPTEYEHLSDYINTLRGTNNTTSFSRGLTTPFCTMPNGFNFFTPVNNVNSNTHYSYFKNDIAHFSVSHVPSTWTGDYGTWQFMANTSIDTSDVSKLSSSKLSYDSTRATFSHDNEIAKAHYYSVTFDEGSRADGVQVEITPTTHGVYVRFTFPKDSDNVNIIFDCTRAGGSLTYNKNGTFTAVSQHTDRGSSNMNIYGEFSQAPSSYKAYGKTGVAVFPKGTTEVTLKFATSFISKNQAKHNLELEIPNNETFDSIFKKAQKAWDDICGIIEVEGASYTELTTLYSCMYRMYSYPNLYSENEGTNEEPDWVYASPYKNGRKTSGKLYVNNGFWDTYRTAWAAYALLTPTLDGELLDGLLQHYKDNGWIPRWVAPGGTNSMLGTSSDIIFADAYAKGIEFDYETAYESMLKNAATVSNDVTNGGRADNHTAIFTGYVPNSVQYGLSWTLEDYISDYCIGAMAAMLGYKEESEYYYNRAKYYVNMMHPTNKFFIGKNQEGGWSSGSGYNPAGWWGDYSETNGWTMAFATVYDGAGLASLYGNKKLLERKLDQYFDNSVASMMKVSVGSIHEMVEAREVRLGQYSHSNQPAHAIPYMYAYTDSPYKTQELTRDVLSRLYVGSEIGQGYCGDEDNGEMSAWYVLSAIGLYPQNMGSGQYIITSPLFDKVTINFDNGKKLVIIANNNSNENVYIQSMTVNGTAYNNTYLNHEVIMNGGTIVYELGSEHTDWGKGSEPMSLTTSGKKANPAEDILTTSNIKAETYKASGSAKNAIYVGSIDDADNLFDNNSNTYATLSKGDSIVFNASRASRVLMYTVSSSSNRGKAPKSFKLEASVDGKTWVTLDEREDVEFTWAKYTRSFSIADDKLANYSIYKLTFTGSNSMQISELELLGTDPDGKVGEATTREASPALPSLFVENDNGGLGGTGGSTGGSTGGDTGGDTGDNGYTEEEVTAALEAAMKVSEAALKAVLPDDVANYAKLAIGYNRTTVAD